MRNVSSFVAPLTCGVPQGSIPGPLLFFIYMLPLGHIIHKHKIQYQCYADDTHIYVLLKTSEEGNFNHLLSCLAVIKCWMSQNLLQLNENKSEIILFGPTKSIPILQKHLVSLSTNIKPAARNLGVIFDSNLSFGKQIKKRCSIVFLSTKAVRAP